MFWGFSVLCKILIDDMIFCASLLPMICSIAWDALAVGVAGGQRLSSLSRRLKSDIGIVEGAEKKTFSFFFEHKKLHAEQVNEQF